MSNAILRHKIGEGAYRDYELNDPVTTIGRSGSNDIVINDTSLSRLHIRIENRSGTYFLIDNNSSNGTFLNRRKITESQLASGDTIMAGRVYFYFVFKEDDSSAGDMTEPATVSMQRFDIPKPAAEPDTPEPMAPVAPPPPAPPIAEPPAPAAFDAPVPPPPPSPPANEAPPPLQFSAPPEAPPPSPPPAAPAIQPSVGGSAGERATPVNRLLAYLIDVGTVVLAQLPGYLITFTVSQTLGGILNMVVSLAVLAYFPYAWHKYGKTFGKHIMKIRVVESASPGARGIELKAALLRTVGYIVCGITCGLGFLYIFFNEEGLGIQDKLAGTEVVQDG